MVHTSERDRVVRLNPEKVDCTDGGMLRLRSGRLSYIDKAGVDVVTACAAVPAGQLDTIIIV